MIHKWCTLSEFTNTSVYTHIHRHNTEFTIAIRIYAWFAIHVQFSSSQYQCIYLHTHALIILKTLQISEFMQGSRVRHIVESTTPRLYFTNTQEHYNQSIKDIRMHAWFASYAYCWSPLCQVHIPTYTCTYHPLVKLLLTSGCMRVSQVMHTNRFYVDICIYPHTDIKLRIPLPSGCIYGSHVMHTVPVHYVICMFLQTHTHITEYSNYYRHQDAYVIHKWCTLSQFAITSVYTHILRRNTQSTIAIRIYAWFATDVQWSSLQYQAYISTYTHTHNTQNTTEIRMHARFASDAHCRVHKLMV